MEKIINLKRTYISIVIAACAFATHVTSAQSLTESQPLVETEPSKNEALSGNEEPSDKKASLKAREASATNELSEATDSNLDVNGDKNIKSKKKKVFNVVEPSHFQKVKFNENFTSYTLLPDDNDGDNVDELADAETIAVTVKDEFYVKRPMEKNKNILISFGAKVRKIRKEKELSQEELAHKADLHRTYIGMIERAEKNITLVNIEKIANALEVKIEDLLKHSDNGNND